MAGGLSANRLRASGKTKLRVSGVRREVKGLMGPVTSLAALDRARRPREERIAAAACT
jgi:hypothetical protein